MFISWQLWQKYCFLLCHTRRVRKSCRSKFQIVSSWAWCKWKRGTNFKGCTKRSSDPQFWSSILCDVFDMSWWLISRSTQNRLKMTLFNFRVGPCRFRFFPRLTPKWTGIRSELPLSAIHFAVSQLYCQGRINFSNHAAKFHLELAARRGNLEAQIILGKVTYISRT